MNKNPSKSYIIVWFNQVVKLSAVDTGILILVGEIVDGVSTLFCGSLMDKFGCFAKFLQKKISWHIFGTLVGLLSFCLIFMPPASYVPGEWSQGKGESKIHLQIHVYK